MGIGNSAHKGRRVQNGVTRTQAARRTVSARADPQHARKRSFRQRSAIRPSVQDPKLPGIHAASSLCGAASVCAGTISRWYDSELTNGTRSVSIVFWFTERYLKRNVCKASMCMLVPLFYFATETA